MMRIAKSLWVRRITFAPNVRLTLLEHWSILTHVGIFSIDVEKKEKAQRLWLDMGFSDRVFSQPLTMPFIG